MNSDVKYAHTTTLYSNYTAHGHTTAEYTQINMLSDAQNVGTAS